MNSQCASKGNGDFCVVYLQILSTHLPNVYAPQYRACQAEDKQTKQTALNPSSYNVR